MLIVFFVLSSLLCFVTRVKCFEGFSVTVYKDMNKTDGLVLKMNGCTALPTAWRKTIQRLDTNGTCVDIWDGNYCSGKPLRIQDRKYENDLSEANFSSIVQSLTPCVKDLTCTPQDQIEEIKSSNVTLFSDYDFKGNNLTVKIDGCVQLPKFGKLVSMSLSEGGCIEMHGNINCTSGPTTHIIDQSYGCRYCYGLNMAIRSITPCKFYCHTNATIQPNSTLPQNNTLTIFEKINYDGYFLTLIVTNCTKIPSNWETFQSANPHGECFDLYEEDGCNGTWVRVNEPKNIPTPRPTLFSAGPCALNRRALIGFQGPSVGAIIGYVISAIVAVTLVVLIGFYYQRIKIKEMLIPKLTKKDIEWFKNGNPDAVDTNSSGYANVCAANTVFDPKYELKRDEFKIEKNGVLGSGQFGVVYRGSVHNKVNGPETKVAIKTVNQVDVTYIKSLLNEIKVMVYVGRHERILELIGCCIEGLENNELYLVIGFCENGSLQTYLRDNQRSFQMLKGNQYTNDPTQTPQYSNFELQTKKVTDLDLLRWAYQIAQGMEYVATRRIIHGDLATRNVLLDQHLDVKISDFGLSKQLYQYEQYTRKQKQQLPWRWLSLESLKRMEFSEKSDVWSYGVTLWEIFTLGEVPYPGLNWTVDFVENLAIGYRLPCPRLANPIIYSNIILECWRENPEERISFAQLTQAFHALVKGHFETRKN